ncbi:MAG: lspA [Microbacteriaceae bacterium]|nr:lspA [Microbacteriaceae bacterium]
MLAVVAACVYALDQFSKYLVTQNLTEREPVAVLGELLQLNFVRNPGAAFSLFSGTTWVFAIIATAVTIFIVVFAHRIRSIAWAVLFGLLLGGNLGNLTDRLFREPGFGVGHVVDFIQIYWFPAIFNVADMAIVASMGVFIVLTIRGIGLTGKRIEPSPAGGDAAAAPLDAP